VNPGFGLSPSLPGCSPTIFPSWSTTSRLSERAAVRTFFSLIPSYLLCWPFFFFEATRETTSPQTWVEEVLPLYSPPDPPSQPHLPQTLFLLLLSKLPLDSFLCLLGLHDLLPLLYNSVPSFQPMFPSVRWTLPLFFVFFFRPLSRLFVFLLCASGDCRSLSVASIGTPFFPQYVTFFKGFSGNLDHDCPQCLSVFS